MKKNKDNKKATYIFPNLLGDFMAKVDLRTQLEASMMSLTLILFGLTVSTVYLSVYTDFQVWYKVTLVINLLAAMVLLSSNLITTFQQYQNYMEIVKFNKKNKEEVEKEIEPILLTVKKED